MNVHKPFMFVIAPVTAALILLTAGPARSAGISAATEECLGCHEEVTPGIVGDWRASRHAKVTPAERSHRMGDRSAWRISGLVYAHPHPASADTTTLRNSAGLPLPTEPRGSPWPRD